VVLGLLMGWCGVAYAQEGDAGSLALRANEVNQTWCADIYGADISSAAVGYKEVAEVWAELDAALQVEPDASLMYWRGVLAQCLGQDDRAATDLHQFLELLVAPGEPESLHGALQAMESDAQRRIARISAGSIDAARGTSPAVSMRVRQRRTAGGIVFSAGATAAAIGFVINVAIYRKYIGSDDPTVYAWASRVSEGGLGMGIAGAVTSVVGLIVMAAPASKAAQVSLGPGPWVSFKAAF